jgi:hypothetical protein
MVRDNETTPTQIRITDPVIIRQVAEEKRRNGDRTMTRAAGRIIERYFASRGLLERDSSNTNPQPTP